MLEPNDGTWKTCKYEFGHAFNFIIDEPTDTLYYIYVSTTGKIKMSNSSDEPVIINPPANTYAINISKNRDEGLYILCYNSVNDRYIIKMVPVDDISLNLPVLTDVDLNSPIFYISEVGNMYIRGRNSTLYRLIPDITISHAISTTTDHIYNIRALGESLTLLYNGEDWIRERR